MFVRPHRSAEAGLDDSRGHAVHSYVALSQLGGQRPGQTQQGGLTDAVGTQSLQEPSGGDANAVHVHTPHTKGWVCRKKTEHARHREVHSLTAFLSGLMSHWLS